MNVAHTFGIIISPVKFDTELLSNVIMFDYAFISTCLHLHCKLIPEFGYIMLDPTPYKTLVGKLNFLINTRPKFYCSITWFTYRTASKPPIR